MVSKQPEVIKISNYTPVTLLCVALVGEVGYNAVVPWIPIFFPLNVQFPHPLVYKISQKFSSLIVFFFCFRYVIADEFAG